MLPFKILKTDDPSYKFLVLATHYDFMNYLEDLKDSLYTQCWTESKCHYPVLADITCSNPISEGFHYRKFTFFADGTKSELIDNRDLESELIPNRFRACFYKAYKAHPDYLKRYSLLKASQTDKLNKKIDDFMDAFAHTKYY